MGLIRFLFKLVLGLLFLAVFGLAVFSGTVLWKDEQLTFGNFFKEFFSNVAILFDKGRQAFEEQGAGNEAESEIENSDDDSAGGAELTKEKRGQLIDELEVRFIKAKQQLAKVDPTEDDYQQQLRQSLKSFKGVQSSAQKILKSFSFTSDERLKIESFLSESQKQIYWANKFLSSSE